MTKTPERPIGCASSGSLLSLWSQDSVLSIGSVGSVLSVGSVGSALSIGSIGSALSVGSTGSSLSLISAGSWLSTGSLLSAQSRWFLPAVLGRSPVATVAARRIRAWYRDSRLVAIALRTAVLPVFFVAQAMLTGTGVLAGVGVVTLGVFAGLTLMNDLAFDGPAWWMHVSTGLRGWEDRLGRALASIIVFGPVVILTYVIALAIGAIGAAVPWLSVVLVAFLASLGLAVGVGAVLPGTAPRTGGNPFAATSGGAAQGCLTALIAFIGPLVLVLPVVVAVLLTRGSGLGQWATLVGAALYGVALLAIGVVLGGRRLDRRAPEMLGQLAHAQF